MCYTAKKLKHITDLPMTAPHITPITWNSGISYNCPIKRDHIYWRRQFNLLNATAFLES